tara:strand:+ start:6575 stop:7177 length:603 start_codon:yes stop_codon:yes gene_type:complete
MAEGRRHETIPHSFHSLLYSTDPLLADLTGETAMTTMAEIEQKAQGYAAARIELGEAVGALHEDIENLKARYMGMIRKQAETVREHEADLKAAIKAAPDLFTKPKSRTFAGIKVGFGKQPGRLECPDDEPLVAAIRKLYPDAVNTLIKVTEKPVKPALSNLSGKDLKRLGISVVDATDTVIVKPQDSDVDKLVAALIEEE